MLQARRNPKAVNVTNPPQNMFRPKSFSVTVSEFQTRALRKHKEHGSSVRVRLLEMILDRPTDLSGGFDCRKIVMGQFQRIRS
jgi:hypothetical protein